MPIRRDDLNLVPVAVATVAAAVLLAQVLLPIEEPMTEAPPMILQRTPPVLVRTVADAPAVTEKSIFSAGRGRASAEAGAAVPVDLDAYTLIGTVTAGGREEAILRAPGSATMAIRAGASIAGWRVVAVHGDSVTFEQDVEQRVLRIGGGSAVPTP